MYTHTHTHVQTHARTRTHTHTHYARAHTHTFTWVQQRVRRMRCRGRLCWTHPFVVAAGLAGSANSHSYLYVYTHVCMHASQQHLHEPRTGFRVWGLGCRCTYTNTYTCMHATRAWATHTHQTQWMRYPKEPRGHLHRRPADRCQSQTGVSPGGTRAPSSLIRTRA